MKLSDVTMLDWHPPCQGRGYVQPPSSQSPSPDLTRRVATSASARSARCTAAARLDCSCCRSSARLSRWAVSSRSLAASRRSWATCKQ